MAFNIVTFSNSLKNLFDKNNTTTSSHDVSGSLKTRVQSVRVGYHRDKPIPNVNYPCIWVEPKSTNNEFGISGNNSKREITLNYDIVGVVQIGIGYDNGREISDSEMLQLQTNIEKLIRNYPKLSITSQVMEAQITGTDFDVVESIDTYNSMAKLNLNIKIWSD